MARGEGVAGYYGVFDEVLAVLAARDGLLVVYSRLCTTHFLWVLLLKPYILLYIYIYIERERE